MIKIAFNNGIALIFNADDWYELRTKHRIIGEFYGSTRTSPIALPVALSPEETLLLITKGIISLKRWNNIEKAPSAIDKTKYEQQLDQLFDEQKTIFKDERKKQIENRIDIIIEGRKLNNSNISKEEIIQEELNKLPEVKRENIIIPIHTQHPDYLRGDETDVPITELLKYTTELKCLVFQDLWEREYFITCGQKFGGDFLVYLGDPVSFHAVYIVKCVTNTQEQNVTEIVAFGRLGNAVKKKFVLASVEDKKVSYLTLSWIDSDFN